MKWIVLLLVFFLVFGAMFIISNEKLKLSKYEDFSKFYDIYYSWFGSLGDNAMRITGNVIEQKWLPSGNESIEENIEEIS